MRRREMMQAIRKQGERHHQELRRRLNRAHELAQLGMREAEAELQREAVDHLASLVAANVRSLEVKS